MRHSGKAHRARKASVPKLRKTILERLVQTRARGFTVCAPLFPARISAPARTESFFITFDNANGDEQDQVFRGVIGPGVGKSVKVGTHYRHENTLRTMMEFPQRDSTWAQRERQKYSSQAAWDREQEIVHEAGGGESNRDHPERTGRVHRKVSGSDDLLV